MKNLTFAFAFLFGVFVIGCNQVVNFAERAPKKYQEEFRPQIHFTPDSNWMNDPNGMVFFEGEYHLFYQFYPDSNVWGPMHWGHAISKDLIYWEHQPVAIAPDFNGWIFSGSAVVDWNNTTRFAENGVKPLVAIFTQHLNLDSGFVQRQSIAYSLDKGRTWKMYINNPVLEDSGLKDFRDPKVFWHAETSQWIMTLACGNQVRFYSSPNLKNWNFEREFGKEFGNHGGVWECPDLIQLPVNNANSKKWVLLVSTNPGGLHGGSGTQYFVGEFDGKKFVSETKEDTIQWLDYGADNYAGVTYSNVFDDKSRLVFIGWMSNWQYAQVTPTKRWRSALTLPRYLSLIKTATNYQIQAEPIDLKLLWKSQFFEAESLSIQGEKILFTQIPEGVYDLHLTLKNLNNPVSFEFGNNIGNKVQILMDPANKVVTFDRSQSGIIDFNPAFGAKHTSPFQLANQDINIQFVVDKSSIELFINNGQWVATEQLFPEGGLSQLKVISEDTELNKIHFHSLKSIW
ncbi:MAG: glycoside hydrolase family 32 protein [Salinivirgaceae bacterium]